MDIQSQLDYGKGIFAKLGLGEDIFYGAAGSLFGESGFSPTAYNPNDPNGGSFGLGQWNGPRKKALVEFARANGYADWTDPKAQWDFIAHELQTTEKKTLDLLRNAEDMNDATRIWTYAYERPADPEGSMKKRQDHAVNLSKGLITGAAGDDLVSGGMLDPEYAVGRATRGQTETGLGGNGDIYSTILGASMGTSGDGVDRLGTDSAPLQADPAQALVYAIMNQEFGADGVKFAAAHVGLGDKGKAKLSPAAAILGGLGGYGALGGEGGLKGALVGEALGNFLMSAFGGANK